MASTAVINIQAVVGDWYPIWDADPGNEQVVRDIQLKAVEQRWAHAAHQLPKLPFNSGLRSEAGLLRLQYSILCRVGKADGTMLQNLLDLFDHPFKGTPEILDTGRILARAISQSLAVQQKIELLPDAMKDALVSLMRGATMTHMYGSYGKDVMNALYSAIGADNAHELKSMVKAIEWRY